MAQYLTTEETEPRLMPDGAVTIVVHLFAFFDDAGTDQGSSMVTCAGYLAVARRWDAFSDKWGHLLRSYHIRAGEFSMKRFAQSTGPFRGWDEGKRRSFMARALALIQQYVERGFAVFIQKEDYDKSISEEVKTRVGGYFPFCAEMCVNLVEEYVAAKANRTLADEPTESIDYVFEKGSQGAGRVQTAFEEYFWQIDRSWCRGFSHENKRSSELHAADIMAYETCKNIKDIQAGKSTLRHPFKTLLLGVPHTIFGPDAGELEQISRDL
jgi:hypothetical protein